MEKPAPERLIDAGLALLADEGAAGVTVRSVEGRAGVPHGSVRHHFGGLDGLRHALVDGLLAREVPGDEPVEEVLRRWLGPDAPIARARYELMLMASRDEGLRTKVLQGRQVFVDQLVAIGAAPRLRRGRWSRCSTASSSTRSCAGAATWTSPCGSRPWPQPALCPHQRHKL